MITGKGNSDFIETFISKVRTKAIKEFAARLKANQIEVDVSDGYGKPCNTGAVTVIEIDRTLEEMVGDES